MYPRIYVLLYHFTGRRKHSTFMKLSVYQTHLRHSPVSSDISDTSLAAASIQRYIRHISSSDPCSTVYQTRLRHWPVSSDVSDTSGSDQCPTMYQSHFWQWPVSIGISDTSSALTSVQRYIRHVFGIGQCPAMY